MFNGISKVIKSLSSSGYSNSRVPVYLLLLFFVEGFTSGRAMGTSKLAPKSPESLFTMVIFVIVHSVGSTLAHFAVPAVLVSDVVAVVFESGYLTWMRPSELK